MANTLPMACRCGVISGQLTQVDSSEGTHVVCHCNSCRRAMELAGLAEDASEGVHLFQTTPDRVRIASGAERLVPREFSKKGGIYRWHASCCDTPMFNTMKTSTIPFVGVLARNLAETGALGPVLVEGFVTDEHGKQRHRKLPTMMWRFLKRAASARLSGRYRHNPFFDKHGDPRAAPELLTG